MNLILIQLGVAFSAIILSLLIYRKIKKVDVKNFTEDITSINGVHVGESIYGDIDSMTCVSVDTVEDGMVKYTTFKDGLRSEPKLMEVGEFLTTFYYFPNGCDFSYKGVK